MIGDGGISTDPEKVSAIRNWPTPKNVKQVRGFLGIAGWYRRFIENFSSVVFPITETLSSKKKFSWTPDAHRAFEQIKTLLSSSPVLINPDFSKKFYLHCDASDYGIGAVLVQMDEEGNERPVAFMSRKLNSAQRNYSRCRSNTKIPLLFGATGIRDYNRPLKFGLAYETTKFEWAIS